jgi:hypothetical protein
LEQKFQAHYFIGSNDKKLIDLTTLRQRNNETPMDQLTGMAVAGMLPAIREKLFGMEFDNLGQLSHRLSFMSNQAYGFKKDSRFAKHSDIRPVRLADGWCWFVLREKYCWLLAGGWFVTREKYCWLVADKPSEQGDS